MVLFCRDYALSIGSVFYFTGAPCKNGHTAMRYTNTGVCYACKRKQNKDCNTRNPETHKKITKKTYEKRKPQVLAASNRWVKRNLEKSREIKRQWKLRNIETYNKNEALRMRKKRATDPFFRLNRNTSKSIWESLKYKKQGMHWESLVNFSLQELTDRLQSLFRDGMTWENYGSVWELDHIKPLVKCSTFEEAWNLTNLQPLTIFENRSKGDTYLGTK